MDNKQFYQQNGYVLLPQLLDNKNIAQLRHSVMSVYKQWHTNNQHTPGFDQLVNMHSLTYPQYFKSHPELRLQFFDLLASAKLVNILKAYFGEAIYFHNTQLFFNPVDKTRNNYWHRDLQYSPISDEQQQQLHLQLTSLHVRIPLIDETGIELIPHSHIQWDSELERNVRFALHGHQQHDHLPHSQLMTLKQGDVLIFNAQMIHRGRYDFNHERLALDICIGKPHPLIQGSMETRVQPTADELAQLENSEWFIEAGKLF